MQKLREIETSTKKQKQIEQTNASSKQAITLTETSNTRKESCSRDQNEMVEQVS